MPLQLHPIRGQTEQCFNQAQYIECSTILMTGANHQAYEKKLNFQPENVKLQTENLKACTG